MFYTAVVFFKPLLYYMKHDKLVFTCHKYYHGTITKTINDYYIIHSYTTITTLI